MQIEDQRLQIVQITELYEKGDIDVTTVLKLLTTDPSNTESVIEHTVLGGLVHILQQVGERISLEELEQQYKNEHTKVPEALLKILIGNVGSHFIETDSTDAQRDSVDVGLAINSNENPELENDPEFARKVSKLKGTSPRDILEAFGVLKVREHLKNLLLRRGTSNEFLTNDDGSIEPDNFVTIEVIKMGIPELANYWANVGGEWLNPIMSRIREEVISDFRRYPDKYVVEEYYVNASQGEYVEKYDPKIKSKRRLAHRVKEKSYTIEPRPSAAITHPEIIDDDSRVATLNALHNEINVRDNAIKLRSLVKIMYEEALQSAGSTTQEIDKHVYEHVDDGLFNLERQNGLTPPNSWAVTMNTDIKKCITILDGITKALPNKEAFEGLYDNTEKYAHFKELISRWEERNPDFEGARSIHLDTNATAILAIMAEDIYRFDRVGIGSEHVGSFYTRIIKLIRKMNR